MVADHDDAIIVRSTIELARDLGLQVVAEGVETSDTFDRLALLGCDLAQGFFLREPVSATEMTSWLDTLNRRGNGHPNGNGRGRAKGRGARVDTNGGGPGNGKAATVERAAHPEPH